MARAWHAWRARGYGAKPKARAPSIVALPAALGRSKPSIPRPAMTRVEKQSAFPRGPHPPASVSFFDEDPAWDAVVAAETQASNENTPNDARDGAALAMSDDFVASQPLEYERSIAVFVCLAVAAVVLSVPFGFVRWNLSTLAPLVWWQLGLSTALGTAAAGPLVYACTLPAIRSRVNFPGHGSSVLRRPRREDRRRRPRDPRPRAVHARHPRGRRGLARRGVRARQQRRPLRRRIRRSRFALGTL